MPVRSAFSRWARLRRWFFLGIAAAGWAAGSIGLQSPLAAQTLAQGSAQPAQGQPAQGQPAQAQPAQAQPAQGAVPDGVPGARILAPRSYGLDIPAGPVSWPEFNVRMPVEGVWTVGQVKAQVGEHLIVLMPDGQMMPVPVAQAQPTDAAYEPLAPEALAQRIARGPLQGFRTKHSRRHVFVYNTSEPFAEATRRIMESMYRGVIQHLRQQNVEVHDSPVPMVVLMFATEAEFQRYQRMPPSVVAYYDMMTNYVVLHADFDALGGRRDIAQALAYSTIAHEHAHQILHNVGVQQRLSLWPMWLAEGLAEYYAPTGVGRNFQWKGPGVVNDLRMFELELYMQSQHLRVAGGETLRETITAGRLESTGYAAAWSLTHYLARRHRPELFRYVQFLSALRPFEGMIEGGRGEVEESLAHFNEFFKEDLSEVESQVVAHLQALPYTSPLADQPHVVATIVLPDGGAGQKQGGLFYSPELAQRWVRDLVLSLPEESRPQVHVELLQLPNRQAAHRYLTRWQR